MATRWLPNLEELFDSYYRVLVDGINHVDLEDDRSDYFSRRIEDYEQTLRVLAARLLEAVPQRTTLHYNISRLLDITANTRARLEDRAIDRENRQFAASDETFQAPVEQSESQGRPRLAVNEDDVSGLRRLGFSWTDIGSMVGVSSRTLRRRRHESGTFTDFAFADIPDNELDNIVRGTLQITPQAGRNLVRGSLLSRGLHVQRRRIEASIARVDPVTTSLRDRIIIIRRIYNVPCPNFLWHIDGNHKLITPYRIVIHGGIDGFSRLIVFLGASSNNRADTVLRLFHNAIARYNIPSRVRSDYGMENIDVGRFMIATRGLNRGSFLTGSSVRNQRIERLWRETNRIIASRFVNIFLYLEQQSIFNPDSELHLLALHIVYLPLVNDALHAFVEEWNSHPVTSACNYTPIQLWVRGMLSSRNSSYSAVNDVITNRQQLENLGVDEDGPVPQQQSVSVNHVEVPELQYNLTDEQERVVHEIRQRFSTDTNGISCYLEVLQYLSSVLDM